MLKIGSVLEATPAYQAAVARQQAKERERLQPRKIVLLAAPAPVLSLKEKRAQTAFDKAERQRLYLWHLMAEYNSARPCAASILEVNARKHGVSVDDLRSDVRKREIVAAKHDAIVDLHLKRPDFSLSQIGSEMNKDHTTVLHALRKRNVPSKRRNVLDVAAAQRMFESGLNAFDISDCLGFSVDAVRRATKEQRKKLPDFVRTHRRIMLFAHLPIEEMVQRTGYKLGTIEKHLRNEAAKVRVSA